MNPPMPAAPPHRDEDASLLREFSLTQFGVEALGVVRTPGRVNLIGEHIDYNGYPVLPIAIEQCFLMAISTNSDGQIRIVNYVTTYESFSCDVSKVSNINNPPKWYDYVLCGIYRVQQELDITELLGMNLAVWGNIPPCAGLSSSSALVCGAALATITLQITLNSEHPLYEDPNGSFEIDIVNNQDDTTVDDDLRISSEVGISMNRLAQLCAAAEKYVGTEGGGMDQAACLLSKPGCAQLISFNPLKCEKITLPKGATFVVANSFENINKAATSDFNCRVMECRLACHVLSKASGLDWEQISNLAILQNKLEKTFEEMTQLVNDTLHPEAYTVDEVAQILLISTDNLRVNILSENTGHINSFQLLRRSLHVLTEADRVYKFKAICDAWRDGEQQDEDSVLSALGQLMLASHRSARDDYECSHHTLDTLVELSSQHAVGARLTGAGWGGCVVALVPEASVAAHMGVLLQQYYAPLSLGPEAAQRAVFVSHPAVGATVHTP